MQSLFLPHIQFTPSYLSFPVVPCSYRVGRHPRATTGRAGRSAGKGWSSAGRLRGALHRHTAWHSQAWTLNKDKEHRQGNTWFKSINGQWWSVFQCVCVRGKSMFETGTQAKITA